MPDPDPAPDVLVAFASRHGATRGVAERIAARLHESGLAVASTRSRTSARSRRVRGRPRQPGVRPELATRVRRLRRAPRAVLRGSPHVAVQRGDLRRPAARHRAAHAARAAQHRAGPRDDAPARVPRLRGRDPAGAVAASVADALPPLRWPPRRQPRLGRHRRVGGDEASPTGPSRPRRDATGRRTRRPASPAASGAPTPGRPLTTAVRSCCSGTAPARPAQRSRRCFCRVATPGGTTIRSPPRCVRTLAACGAIRAVSSARSSEPHAGRCGASRRIAGRH